MNLHAYSLARLGHAGSPMVLIFSGFLEAVFSAVLFIAIGVRVR
jgi:hypothetical protein